jgi:hypothetical protein
MPRRPSSAARPSDHCHPPRIDIDTLRGGSQAVVARLSKRLICPKSGRVDSPHASGGFEVGGCTSKRPSSRRLTMRSSIRRSMVPACGPLGDEARSTCCPARRARCPRDVPQPGDVPNIPMVTTPSPQCLDIKKLTVGYRKLLEAHHGHPDNAPKMGRRSDIHLRCPTASMRPCRGWHISRGLLLIPGARSLLCSLTPRDVTSCHPSRDGAHDGASTRSCAAQTARGPTFAEPAEGCTSA